MTGRAAQLDGLRAVAMLLICWDHWRPQSWTRLFPYEIALFFFLVLTGYLITGSLLREQDRAEEIGKPWRKKALQIYQIRRGLRILAPYYAALVVALIVGARDVWEAPLWYVFHVSNIHMATLPDWPAGSNHFWSLAMQQQFYLVWPFVIWFLPRRFLVWAMLLVTAVGPVSRWYHDDLTQWFVRPDVLTVACLDYFGIGGLLALAVHRGMSLESPALRWLSGLAFAAYLTLFCSHAAGYPTYGLRMFQQAFLAIGVSGIIAAAAVGFSGGLGRFLLMPWLQKVGALSYGLYLYHNLAPLVAGKLFWFLWGPGFQGLLWDLVRVLIFAAVAWSLTLASWRWIEKPLQEVRSRIRSV